ncbi:helix-turn-helix domain-containing protein [Pseudomonas putida]|uniref:helix-turn-helix domain-containing protein n=1 Tax=Pseudomonas putida TaxID=303 RepID=UPI002AC6E7E1|nr:helix-turn-helix domain-containing protein [Pseudomonas putida]MDZ5111827.1 helix-turn-helix domain-containing protein [Pseudomonas putida]
MITIEDIAKTQHKQLNTLSSKLIYLIIRNEKKEDGWSAISLAAFESATGMSSNSVARTLNRLIKVGLIERNPNKERPNSTNEFRIIEL